MFNILFELFVSEFHLILRFDQVYSHRKFKQVFKNKSSYIEHIYHIAHGSYCLA